MTGREICTLLPTLESNRKPVLPSHEAVTRMDEKTKAAYRQYFDQRHGVRSLPDLQPGDSVRVKLDQQKGWKSPRKVIAKKALLLGHTLCTSSRHLSLWCMETADTLAQRPVLVDLYCLMSKIWMWSQRHKQRVMLGIFTG